MQAALQNLPKHLTRKIGNTSPHVNINCANARWARKEIFIPAMNRSGRYFSRMNTLVGKNLVRLGRIGTTTTWVLPTAFGVYNTWNAAPEQRGLVGTQEAVGIIWGAAGTYYALSILGGLAITSAGAFLVVALIAGLVGWGLAEAGKKVGKKAYNFGENISFTYF